MRRDPAAHTLSPSPSPGPAEASRNNGPANGVLVGLPPRQALPIPYGPQHPEGGAGQVVGIHVCSDESQQ